MPSRQRLFQRGKSVKIMDADEAVSYIPDNSTVGILGAGGGLNEATSVIDALAARYKETSTPKQLTLFHSSGLGNRADRGMSPLALPGLSRRVIGGHWGQSPALAAMAERNEFEAYNFPQGVMSQMLRAAAAGQPGILTHVGLGSFVDPRSRGGKLNESTQEDLVKLMQIGEKDWLFYPAIPIDVAIIRGTTADTEGYISMEDEIAYLDVLALAQAAHNNGGIVIAQVQKVVKARTLHPKSIRVPGFLVDALVVIPEQPQLYVGSVNRYFSGDYKMDTGEVKPLPLDVRKMIARRALFEVSPGDVGNVGVGISDGVGVVAQEEGVNDEFTLTVELGPIGGVSAQGIYLGASVNSQAVLDMPAQFDFYDGGGLDIALLSFAEVDSTGSVNVHRFGGKIMGTGGFINIAQNSKTVVFSGTLTAGGLEVDISDRKLRLLKEGRFTKFVTSQAEVTFSGPDAFGRGQKVIYITERAVFTLGREGLVLVEVAPGIDLDKDVLAHMEFTPIISEHLKEMDPRIYSHGQMGIRDEWLNRALSMSN